jgi:WD40 repeat protein
MLEALPSVLAALRGAVLLALPLLASGGAAAQDIRKVHVVAQVGHSAEVRSISLSPDGRRALSGSVDKTLKLWDVATGRLLRTFEGHAGWVMSVALSPDGRSALSGSSDRTLKLWDVAGRLLRTFEGHADEVASVAFSPNGRSALSGSSDRTLKLWDVATGRLLRTFEGHSAEVRSISLSPDGRSALSGSVDKMVKLWDVATGRPLRTFEGHADEVASVAFSPDGRSALSSSEWGTLKLWDAATGRLLRTFEGHADEVASVAFSPDGRSALSSSEWGTLKLWDAATGRLLRTFEERTGGVTSLAFTPDGRSALSGSLEKTVKLWDVSAGRLLRTFEEYRGGVTCLAFAPDGRIALSGGSDNALNLWDAATGRLLRTFEGHSSQVQSVAFSPDGRRALSGSHDKTIKLWDVATGRLMRTFEGHASGVMSVAFSADDRGALSGSADGTLQLWDVATGRLLRTFEKDTNKSGLNIYSFSFSLDGRSALLGGGADKTLRLWDVGTGRLLRTFEGHARGVTSVALSSDGRSALSGSFDETVKLWDVATGRLLRTFEGHLGVALTVAFSADGRNALSGSSDRTLKLWDVATGRLLRTFEGHSSQVRSVAFSPDARRALSGSMDGTVRFWSLETGREIVQLLTGHGNDSFALTPVGFFDFRGGEIDKFVHLVRDPEVLSVGQVHQSLFNPDLVREALAGDPAGEVREAARVINLEKVVGSGPAPAVLVRAPARSSADVVTVETRVNDRGKGVGRIEWRVNGVTAGVTSKPLGAGPVHTVTRQLALDPGDNAIEVVAYNGSNLLASQPARTTVKFSGPSDGTKPNLHILAIGINAYIDKGWAPPGKGLLAFGPLGLAVKDAKAFVAGLEKAVAGLYDKVHIALALDKDATRDNLHKVVDKVAAQIHPRDSFILFAAAHGDAERGRFYLIPQDYQSGPPGTLAQRAISQDDLQDWLANRIKARRAIVFLDTCESGSLISGHMRSRVDNVASEAAVGRLHEATGRPVLTAAAAGQFAHEGLIGASGDRHGVFTWAVLDALREGDNNGNGLIELSELVAHVQTAVPKIAAQMGGRGRAVTSEPVWGKQSARFGSRGEDFAVARRLQ